MTIKSVLVVMQGGSGDEARLAEAIAIAKHQGADVAALHVKPTPALYVGSPGVEIPAAMIDAQIREIDDAARSIEVSVKAQAEKAGIPVEWRCEEGDEVAVGGTHARYSDLAVATPDLARDLVFVSACPVLAFPNGAKPAVPKRLLVAWNGSRESARAVRDAMPLIKMVEGADVLVVDPPGDRPIGQDLGRALARHGVNVNVRERLSSGADIGGVLLEEARTSGADVLVMGAYGHSRFREWVLGGATEGALSDATIPVLLSH